MLYKLTIASAVASASAYTPSTLRRPTAVPHRAASLRMAEATSTEIMQALERLLDAGVVDNSQWQAGGLGGGQAGAGGPGREGGVSNRPRMRERLQALQLVLLRLRSVF